VEVVVAELFASRLAKDMAYSRRARKKQTSAKQKIGHVALTQGRAAEKGKEEKRRKRREAVGEAGESVCV
jgi:hypothetical protein